VHKLAERVLRHIREEKLLRPGDRLGIAVSGGPDSVALLRLMLEFKDELGVVLSVVHFNHQIRGTEADADQQFVSERALFYSLELRAESADTPAFAKQHKLSLEDAARRLRYQYFRKLLCDGVLNRIATAHTMDDQAETVLMRIVRGTGTRGLAGISERIAVGGGAGSDAAIVRPLLPFRRAELRQYLRDEDQNWREDSSNLDLHHTRNRIRQLLIPLMEKEFNPAVSERLSELAEIAQAEEEYWQSETQAALALFASEEPPMPHSMSVPQLQTQPLAMRRRIVRAIAERLGVRLEFQSVEAILNLAQATKSGEKTLTVNDDWQVVRHGNQVSFEQRQVKRPIADYEYRLDVPGEIEVPELGSRFRASLNAAPTNGTPNKQNMVTSLSIRNWRPGDRYQPAHSKSPRKIKELLQAKHLQGWERLLWPVVVCGENIIWVRGFPSPNSDLGRHGVIIEEFSIQNGLSRRK
jgi:tRNA(Ile)-lysidine synthase